MRPVDLLSIKAKARKHWKWLAASALAVAWITASCGVSALSTKPVCTSITMAIRGLLSHTATPPNAQQNNSKTATTSRQNNPLLPLTSATSSALCERQIRATKSAISTAENMANSAVLTITYVYSITPSTTNICGRMTKASIHIPQKNSTATGRSGSLLAQNLPWTMPLIRPATASKKSQANAPRTTTNGSITIPVKHGGSCLNMSACPQDAANHQE